MLKLARDIGMGRTSFTLRLVYSTRFHQVLHYSSTGCISRSSLFILRDCGSCRPSSLYRRDI